MSDLSRRKFIKAGAVVGAVAATPVGTAAAVGRHGADAGDAAAEIAATPLGRPVMVYVKDASTHEVVVMTGDAEVTVKDAELVRRVARATRQVR